jgi:rRNA biogenesis protein RRP5
VVQLAPKNKLNSIGFLSKVSYNGPNEFLKSLSIGKEVTAVVSGYCSKSTTTLPKKTPLLVFPEEVFVKPRSNSVISNSSDDDSTLKRGSVVEGVISDITRTSVKVTLATNPQSHTNVLASVFLTDLIDLNEDNSKKNVLLHMRSLDIGTKITAKCLWVADQSISGNTIAQLTTRPSELESSSLAKRYSWKDISQILTSKQIFGVVLEILETGAWVAISPTLKGFVYATNCSHDDDIDLLNDQGVAGVLQLGQVVACKVLSFDNDQHHLELSLRASDLLTEASNAYPVGSIVVGQALALNSRSRLKVSNAPAINLQVSKNSYGRVCVTHLTDRDHWVDVPFGRKTSKKEKKGMDSILPGKFVRCCVLSHKNGQLDLSMRSSLVFAAEKNSGGSGTKWLDNLLKSDDLDQFKSGDITKGYVVKTVKQGCFVRMSPSVIARVMISNLSDSFIKHADKVFYPSKLVVGKILTLDTKSRRMELTLKNSAVKVRKEKPEEAGRLTFNSIKVDQILEATVSKVESYGVFVKFINSGTPGISALCHISEATDKFVKKLSKLFSVGDLVKSKVVKIDRKSKNISISLKPSNFADIEEGDDTPDAPKGEHVGFSSSSEEEDGSSSDDGSDSEEDDSGDEEPSVSGNKFEKTDSSVAKEASGSESSDSDSSSNSDSDEGSDMETESSEKKTSGFSFKGFQGFAGLGKRDSDSESSDSESDSDGEGNKRKKARSSRKKARSRRQEEAAIVAQEEALLDGNVIPESVSDFERLVISSPNSSFAWIKYMAFQLSLTEIDLARGIAERALKKINYREGEEKLNVWLAYLNLEYKYGVDSTFNTLFKRAVQVNDPITIYLRMAKIYTEGGDAERAMSMYTRAMKKYGSKSTALYADYGLFAIQTGNKYIQFRSILGEALKRLPDREHISLITKFAIMEFKHGSAERGRTIFEEVVGNYPKRVDVWNMYLDQEVSLNTASGDIKRVRKLFDRVVSMKFSSKKMKFLFKKYLQFEQVNGTADGEEKVKDLARSWVESQ